jgi:hypothetical protein
MATRQRFWYYLAAEGSLAVRELSMSSSGSTEIGHSRNGRTVGSPPASGRCSSSGSVVSGTLRLPELERLQILDEIRHLGRGQTQLQK